ncbi:TIR domain-containing protein [Quadrisphaera granulorum]|uniref:TIR domain-containing protein n=1 Tax=Quadrisphaera granulorum TaxID=317664 RepID=A0A316AA79_9ACTN|nr:TIR domain-containing protein [Quadrisphaera granulorum]PWJ54309.1 TIR domain-containing protein [Quadrisphaera granulorum]SZE96081.1 TIR domain-containing protein [Quadrisphaera granulorum]
MTTGANGTDPRGPIFISYRQSDGAATAAALAWTLRAAGMPVWHDATDLPPGDTNERLAQALQSGLSGAVLLVTPEIQKSMVELPRLLELEQDPNFVLVLAEHRAGW